MAFTYLPPPPTSPPHSHTIGLNSGHYVTYVIAVDLTTGTVVLRHPRGHAGKTLRLEDSDPPKKLGHLAVGCWKKPVALRDLIVLQNSDGNKKAGGRKKGGGRGHK